MNTFPDSKQTFLINGPVGMLELETTAPQNAITDVAVVCHPNPTQEGTMYNKVVTTTVRAFEHCHFATVRFNFRGVGRSVGSFGHTVGEIDDLRMVLAWVKQVLPTATLHLAGFSFGSYIAAYVAHEVQPKSLISLAPPMNLYDYQQFTEIDCPWLIVQGDQDEVVDPKATIDFAGSRHSQGNVELVVMPGIGHFFHRHLIELRDVEERFIRQVVSEESD